MPRAQGVFPRAAALLLAAWVLLGAEHRASAGTSDIVTRVACPALPTDMRAEFEARAQVDLTLRAAGGGDLEAVCQGLTARVVWRPKAGGNFERSVSAATPPALVDALLFAVAELAGDAARAAAARRTPPVEPETPAESKTTEPTTSPDAPPRDVPESSPGRAAEPAIPFGMQLGGVATFYSTDGSGALGPHGSILFGLPANLMLTLGGGYDFGFGAAAPVSVHAVETEALLSTFFGTGKHTELGAGLVVGSLSASAAGPFNPPNGQSQVYFATAVRGRYGGTVGGVRIAFGPEIRLNLPPTQVVVVSSPGAEQTAWEISLVSVGFTLDVSAALYGSLW